MISVIIAFYNEEKRFPERYERLKRFLEAIGESWELLLIDDGSCDRTLTWARQLTATDKRIRVLRLHRNHGQGAAIKLGVLASRGDIVICTDADLPVPLPDMLNVLRYVREGTDVAIASRWKPGARILAPQPLPRRMMSTLYYALIHAVILPDIHDTNCGLKVYRGDVARCLFGFVRSWRWVFNVEHLWLARRLRFRIDEVAVEWNHVGQSKVRLVRDCLFTLWELALLELRRLMGGYPSFEGA